MAKPIGTEKRADIIRHMEAGESKGDIAKWLFVCVRTVTRVWNKYTSTGSYSNSREHERARNHDRNVAKAHQGLSGVGGHD